MSLDRIDFDSISEADLTSLIAIGVPEGIAIDYKRDSYSRSDADVKEFLKDISSFANIIGGHLVIGMDEVGGVASAISALTGIDADQEVQRLESLMRDGLEPRVSGIRIRAVPIEAGGFVMVIRIPRSWNPPHRVSVRGSNRFYARNSGGSHEVSVEELRVLFNFSATALDRVRAFRHERLAKLASGDGPVALAAARGKVILHLVPLSAFSGRAQVDLQRAFAQEGLLRPMATMGYSPRFNFDGFINTTAGDVGYMQLFRNGIVESVKVRAVMERNEHLVIPSLDFDRHIFEVLPHYLTALKALEVPPPIVAMLTLEGVRNAVLGVSEEQFAFDPPVQIRQPVLELPEVVIESYGTAEDYQRAVRPAFDALWNAGGFPASQYFTSDGVWAGQRRRS